MLENFGNKTILEIESVVEFCVSEILKHKSSYIDKKSRLFFESLRSKKENMQKIIDGMNIQDKNVKLSEVKNSDGVEINYTSLKDWLFEFMFFLIRTKNTFKGSFGDILTEQIKILNKICD